MAKHAKGSGVDADTAASVQSFLGRWDLTLKTPLREYPSWLEITQEDGQLRARMVSRWGHARPLPKIELTNDRITFISPKEEEDRKDDMVLEGKLSGKTLNGDHDRARWNSVAMDGRESAIPEENELSEVGKDGAIVQRQRPERMEDERSKRNAGLESRRWDTRESRTWP